jgi:hypothetical protein
MHGLTWIPTRKRTSREAKGAKKKEKQLQGQQGVKKGGAL